TWSDNPKGGGGENFGREERERQRPRARKSRGSRPRGAGLARKVADRRLPKASRPKNDARGCALEHCRRAAPSTFPGQGAGAGPTSVGGSAMPRASARGG